jgi:hypothetical protein
MAINTNFPNVRPSLLLDFANAQQLDPRVTFSRSTTAQYYDGKTSVLAEQNLLTYSQLFSNAVWLTGNVTNTTTSATNAPDGTTTAFSSIPTTTNATHQLCEQGITQVSGLQYTFSISVKANGYTLVAITQYTGSANVSSFFDLSAGTVTSGTGSIASQGNGWYRVSQTVTATTSAFNQYACQLFAVNTGTNTSFAGDGTSGYYIWGAQLEQRSAVTAYQPTTTTAITNYIPQLLTAPINAPRFDFNPVTGESLGLLIEQSSTNLLTYSQDFSNAVWAKSNATITASANIAPDGTQTAQLLVESATTTTHYIQEAYTSSASSYSMSVYAKQAQRTRFTLRENSAIGDGATFDLSTGTVIANQLSGVGSITPVGNGWYRCIVVFTGTSGARSVGISLNTSSGSGSQSYTGDGYSGIYIWGAQLEALAFPTSYIATTSAQVTRASDNASMTGTNFSSWYNTGQGTFLIEATWKKPTTTQVYVLSNGSTNRYMYDGNAGLTTQTIQSYDGTNVVSTSVNVAQGTFLKGIVSYGGTSTSINANGNTSVTGSYNGSWASNTILKLGEILFFGYFKKVAFYSQIVTTTNQQALTGS